MPAARRRTEVRSLDQETRVTLCAAAVLAALAGAVLLSVSPVHAAPPSARSAAPATACASPAVPGDVAPRA